jgi:signal transduction histidine kinase
MADFTIVQMLLELCENSIEAMAALPERFIMFHVGVVDIRDQASALGLEAGTYAKVSLVDHGEGIEPDQREVVFQPGASKRSPSDGGGMGVSRRHEHLSLFPNGTLTSWLAGKDRCVLVRS